MIASGPPFRDAAVETAFAAFPAPERAGLLALRSLIFATAAETPTIGAIEETLKWGQPAYLTKETGAGSTLRLGQPKQGGYALFAHCRTTIIADFRAAFPEGFRFEGNRAVLFRAGDPAPADRLRLLIRSALTYHVRRAAPQGAG